MNASTSTKVFFGLGILVSIGIVGLLVSAVVGEGYNEKAYDEGLTQIQANDLLAAQIFLVEEDIFTDEYAKLARGGVEKYNENIVLIGVMREINNLPEEKVQQLNELQIYTELRIQMFELLERSALENTDQYFAQIESIGSQIEKLDIYREGVEQLQELEGET